VYAVLSIATQGSGSIEAEYLSSPDIWATFLVDTLVPEKASMHTY
jgi:hypothetical protein